MKLHVVFLIFIFSVPIVGRGQQKGGGVSKAPLDGVTVVGEISTATDSMIVSDTLFFRGCEFRSGSFKGSGFGQACYTTREISGGTGFSVELADSSGGTVRWKGSVTNGCVEAIIIRKAKGEPTKEYAFLGRTILLEPAGEEEGSE